MPARPTSIRLTAPQAAEVAALARDLSHTRPDLAALAPLTEGGVLRLALAHGLAVLRELADDDDRAPVAPLAGAWLDRPAAPAPPAVGERPPQAVARPCARCGAPAGADCAPSCTAHPASHAPAPHTLTEVQLDTAGTAYRVICWRTAAGSIGAAWPDARWAVGDLSAHAPPGVEWLRSQGVRAGDAPGLAAAIARAWPRVAR